MPRMTLSIWRLISRACGSPQTFCLLPALSSLVAIKDEISRATALTSPNHHSPIHHLLLWQLRDSSPEHARSTRKSWEKSNRICEALVPLAMEGDGRVARCNSFVLVAPMPHKHNADRRHHIPKMSFKVQNWPTYEAGLRRRGSLTLWIEDGALGHWQS
jgi:hypothetical protein